jgi:hypothetical protein
MAGMGHLAGKDVYRDLGRTIDGLTVRAPWSETFRAILRELYTEEEAALVSRLPARPAPLDHIRGISGMEEGRLGAVLDRLADKGLVMDMEMGGKTLYMVSPLVIGIFEFTIMRRDKDVDMPRVAALFKEYLNAAGGFREANFGNGQEVSVMRTIPHVEAIDAGGHVEVLDWEKASAIVAEAPAAAVGYCSCRHEKLHLGEKRCDTPLEMCMSFGDENGSFVKRGLARAISRSEAQDLLAQAREMKLVLNADNVRKGVQFI